ncbi:Activity-regulated cytoskeleton associated protein 2 [Frankliniella fusca]|uniref:Activity-regulated cytoskeleton associated protein 2 n=1 Tax=Frankliniella fusca TaxID=407009 RepID=A0AAE1HIT3_9NEOP|nr:Activity-regulated cytoskeleton associated protein 2 [Frankliniella fusca]
MAGVSRTPVQIDFNSLISDEVAYELDIRDIAHIFRSSEEKSRLISANWGATVITRRLEEYPVEEELVAMRRKVAELEVLLVENAPIRRVSRRLNALYVHCVYRVRRSMFRGNTEEFISIAKRINRVGEACEQAFPLIGYTKLAVLEEDELEARLAALQLRPPRRAPSPPASPPHSSHSKGKTSKKKKKKSKKRHSKRRDSSSSSDSSSESSSDSSEEERPARNRKVREIARLSFHYSGNKGEDLHEFVSKLNNAAEMYDYRGKDLLGAMGALLQGNALTWYTARKHEFRGWGQFVKEIREAFNPAGNDDEIHEKLENLKQSSEETYAVYEARAEELFSRLSDHPSDKEKLRKLLKGLHYYYRSRVKSTDIASLSALRRECRDLEADKMHLMRLEKKETKRREKEIEKEREQKRRSRDNQVFAPVYQVDCSSQSSSSDADVEVAAAVSSTPRVQRAPVSIMKNCWRCGGQGHSANECPVAVFCPRCGLPNISDARSCPNCLRAQAAGQWSVAGPGNQTGAWGGPTQSSMAVPAPFWMQCPPPPLPRGPAPLPQAINPQFRQDTAPRGKH